MRRGVKISLEGIDGVGKTTQTEVARQHLEDRGYNVFFKPCRNNIDSKEIDGDIVSILKNSRRELEQIPAAEVLLNAARTMYMHERYVKEHLDQGHAVLCDRDIDTALAYSMPSLRRHYPEVATSRLTQWMLGVYSIEATVPDLTVLLDADTSVALGRALSDEVPNERAIFDEDGVAFLNEVRQEYLALHEQFPQRIKRIDVGQSGIDAVSDRLRDMIDECLYAREGGAYDTAV